MKKYKFEIQNCINVEIEGTDKDDARIRLIDNLEDYGDEMVDGNCYVSDGEEIQQKRGSEK